MFFSKDEGSTPLTSDEGVGQGDTLALLYYCIGQGEITEETRDTLAEENIHVDLVAYADNIFIPPTLPPNVCFRVYSLLAERMLTLGGVPNNLRSSFLMGNDLDALSAFPNRFPCRPRWFCCSRDPDCLAPIQRDHYVRKTPED